MSEKPKTVNWFCHICGEFVATHTVYDPCPNSVRHKRALAPTLVWMPPTTQRVPMRVHPEARDALNALLYHDERFHTCGYSSFIMAAVKAAREGKFKVTV